MTRAVGLGMYDLPWLRDATDALWADLRQALRGAGLRDLPQALDRARDLRAIWRDPTLLLAQTCGYPLLHELADAVQVVATPVYAFPGCDGVLHRSLVVVRAGDASRTLDDLRGRRCAINGRDSNTGMNLLRAAVAPLAQGESFFCTVMETGAHLRSLQAVRDAEADVAAIDCVTHGLVARHRPELLDGTRVLTQTAATPGLPFITAPATPGAEVAALRQALAAASAGGAAAALGWTAVVPTSPVDYAPIVAIERAAAAAGYSRLA